MQHSHPGPLGAYDPVMARGNRREAIFYGKRGSDARKVLLADLLWRRTVVSQEWLAEKLRMRSAANVGQQMRRLDKKRALGRVLEALKSFLEEVDQDAHE